MRRSRQGFTLIEFLIALVIIGFIVAILVNFFADPLDEAQLGSNVSKVIDTLRTVEAASTQLRMKTGCDKSLATNDCAGRINLGELVSSGVLTAKPALPAAIFVAGGPGAGADGVVSGYQVVATNNASYWAAPGKVFLMVFSDSMEGVTDAVCKEFNKRMGNGEVVLDMNPSYVDKSKGAQCYLDWDGDLLNAPGNLIVWPLWSL